jgi:hypothetical protein
MYGTCSTHAKNRKCIYIYIYIFLEHKGGRGLRRPKSICENNIVMCISDCRRDLDW